MGCRRMLSFKIAQFRCDEADGALRMRSTARQWSGIRYHRGPRPFCRQQTTVAIAVQPHIAGVQAPMDDAVGVKECQAIVDLPEYPRHLLLQRGPALLAAVHQA